MNEIHIKTLKHHLNHWKYLHGQHICEEKEAEETIEALQMAIEALQTAYGPSKQTVKEQMIKYGFHAPDMTVTEFVEDLLPSVTPQQAPCEESCPFMQEDCISRQAINNLRRYRFSCGDTSVVCVSLNDIRDLPSVRTEQKLIYCKDCNEWHRGKNHNGRDVLSDEGYCSVQRLLTGENYYCGDAERR